jgi:hypothetical protein
VTVRADDPDGVQSVKLWWREDRQGWESADMVLNEAGLFQATIPGHESGDIVQFYVQATDEPGQVSTFPAAGPDSRALFQVEDGRGPSTAIDRFRIVIMDAESRDLYAAVNTMSNWILPITLVHNDDVYYDVGVRQIGSRFIRPNSGYKVPLHPDKRFYGVHDSIRFDIDGINEMLLKQMVNRAGGFTSSMYDDLAYLVAPSRQRGHTHEVLLQMARYDNVFLNEQFENGSDGTKWELDDVTVPSGPPRGSESLKSGTQVNQDRDIGVNGATVRSQGDNPEFYRGHLLIKNNRVKDDYESIARLAQAIHLEGDALFEATNEVMDVDLWMRHYADMSFFGSWDTYGFRRPKNLRIYTRPSDNKFIPFFWDCDRCNFTEPIKTRSENRSRLDEIRDIPHNLRLYWGHMLDLMNRSFNPEYTARWSAHYAELANNQIHGGGTPAWNTIVNSIRSRVTQATRDMERDIPPVEFQITTNDGQDFNVDQSHVMLQGKGWVDIRQIRLAGTEQPLDAFWPEEDGWQIQLPLAFGANAIELEAIDYQGNLITTDTITVTSSVGDPVGESLRVTELHYHPADPTAAEANAGYTDANDFEFIELTNIGSQTISLDGVRLERIVDGNDEQGVDFNFADGSIHELAAGQSVLVVEDLLAFQYRYGNQLPVAGQWSGGLNNSSEMVTVSSDGVLLQQFTYSDDWYSLTDGPGRSLQIVDAAHPDLESWNLARSWRPSGTWDGAPGIRESQPGDANHDGVFNSADLLAVLQAGEYEDAIPDNSTFEEGDWNGDGDFNSSDFVWAFKFSRYREEAPARPATAAIAASKLRENPPTESTRPHTLREGSLCREPSIAKRRRQPVQLSRRGVDAVFEAPERLRQVDVAPDRPLDITVPGPPDDLV